MASTTRRDYYEVLGVSPGAPTDEIKRAFRRLAMEYHPDRNPAPDAARKFKEAAEAFEVLADPDKRRVYDTYGYDGLRGRGYGGITDLDDVFEHFFAAGGVFGDLLGDLFGFRRAGRGRRPARGADILARLDVEFEEAAHGVTRDVEVTRLRTCGECGGTGAAAGSTPETCATCHGAGQVIQRQGFFSIGTTCPRCRGEGVVLTNPCAACGGQGRVPEESSLAVNVPEGIADGMRLRLAGEGEGGRFGGPRGDLYVEVRVKPHAIFGRDGQDVLYKLEVSPARAVMGGKVTVPTLWGDEVLKVPAGAQEGNELTLKGAGMPRLKVRGRGDQRVKVHIRIPKKLGKEEKVLYKKILETEEGKPCED